MCAPCLTKFNNLASHDSFGTLTPGGGDAGAGAAGSRVGEHHRECDPGPVGGTGAGLKRRRCAI